ncbi:methyl-accepting chemotaxis protein [Aliiroseovarius marinus]|uniref:methyl-accepting chemotaxis protein n=1 Tax=Aliiroseovarius marinus TaxID=2500159 RepID=UPI003D7E1078
MPVIENQSFESETAVDPRLTELARNAAKLGFNIVDVSGFLDDVDAKSAAQKRAIDGLSNAAQAVLESNQNVRDTMQELLTNTGQNRETAENAAKLVEESAQNSARIADWVKHVATRLGDMAEALEHVQKSNELIVGIASQVNILAVNAKIEAARAGDAGRGFAVVAEAINELSGKTAQAAQSISNDVETLSGNVLELNGESADVADQADHVLKDSQAITTATQDLATRARKNAEDTARIQDDAEKVGQTVADFLPAFSSLGKSAHDTAIDVHEVTKKAHGLVDLSEALVQGSVALGGVSNDQSYIERVQTDAKRIAQMFEDAIDRGEISQTDLFSTAYKPIPGTNPQQVLSPFTALTDRLLPPLLEDALTCAPGVVFCAAVDRRGYLPTHNKVFSQPQGRDPVWNTANCRNRRIFDDRVGLKAGQSSAPFLLQVYRRDMGGGAFVLMKDLSAPIHVKGRHWGGLRMGYKVTA